MTGYNSSVEKEKLHNIMAFGKSELNDDNDQPKHPANSEQEIDRFEEGAINNNNNANNNNNNNNNNYNNNN